MNRDFALPATPASARILRKLAQVTAMNLDPAVAALADQGRAAVSASFSPAEREAIQHILDTGMRCVLPGPAIRSVEMVAEAARIDGIEKVIVMGQHRQWWSQHFKPSAEVEFKKITDGVSPTDSDFFRENRHHLLVIESYSQGLGEQMMFAHSFPKAISLSAEISIPRLVANTGILFDNDPSDALNLNGLQRRELEIKGFKKTSPRDLAFLVNIITDHLDL